MKILLLGSNGQVGWELRRALAPLGKLVALTRRRGRGLAGDLTDLEGLAATIARCEPDVIVNAAAYTAVDRAESEQDLARAVNARAPEALAAQARNLGCLLVHYSTDYVFDGSGERPWREDDPTGPLSIYGATKLEGETAIRESGCRYLVLRTSWVYAARGPNFLRTMLRKLYVDEDRVRVVNDQFGAPTGAELVADVTAQILKAAGDRPDVIGTYHLASAGETTWYEYARFIADRASESGSCRPAGDRIQPVGTSDFPTAAKRPHNSRLCCTLLSDTFGMHLPEWQVGVERAIEEILSFGPHGVIGK